MRQVIECVPNFSEGRDSDKIDKIMEIFRGNKGVKLLDYSSDYDHNRTVVTLIGDSTALKEVIIDAVGVAIELIDLTNHEGQHPRMGAIDVIPLIPIENVSLEECITLSTDIAKVLFEKYNLPSFLYEKSAKTPHRENLANIRKGQFEGMSEKIKDSKWHPDFGTTLHPTAGIVAVGARMPLIAFNVNLATDSIEIANKIAKNVRHISGGLRYCKAIGIELQERKIVQVSMNMTDYTKTPLYRVFELIKIEANRYGIGIVGSEIVGLVPMEALFNTAEYYLGIEKFDRSQVLEKRIMES